MIQYSKRNFVSFATMLSGGLMVRYISLFYLFFLITASLHAQNTYRFEVDNAVFNEGLQLISKNNYGAARITFEKYLSLTDPTSELLPEARYYQAYCAMHLFHKDAESLLNGFVKDYPVHPKAMMAYFELGNFHYRNGEYGRAIEAFEKVNLSNLTKEKAYELKFKFGYSYFTERAFDNALVQFSFCLKQANTYQGAAAYYSAFIAIEEALYDEALEHIAVAENYASYERVTPILKAKTYYGKKDFRTLISYIQPLLVAGAELSEKPLVELLLAEAYYFQEDYRNAYRYYENSLSSIRSTPSGEKMFRAGFAAYESGFFPEAADYLKKAALEDDENGQLASYYLGLTYIRLDNKNYALTAFSNASRKNFNEEVGYQSKYYQGKIYFELGRYDQAIESLTAYNQSSYSATHQGEVNELVSESFMNTDDVNQAIQYIESLSSRSEKVNQVYQQVTYKKAIALFNSGSYYEAVQMFERSLENPIVRDLVLKSYFWTGEAYSIGKRYKNAIDAYQEVLRNNPPRGSETLVKTYYGLGYAYYNTGQYSNALGNFKAYVERAPKDNQQYFYNDALLRLADCHYATKNYNQAVSIYQRAIDAGNPEPDYCFYQIGLVSSILNNREQAERNLNMVLSRFPNSVFIDDALFQKAEIAFENGDYREAIDRFSHLVDQQPQSPFIPYVLVDRAISHANLRDHESSIADYRRVLEEYPRHNIANNALLGLQESLMAANRSDEFSGFLEQYKSANPEDKGLTGIEFESAKNLYFNQKYEQAKAALNQYLASYPESPYIDDVYYYLGESQYRTEDYPEAIQTFQQVLSRPTSKWYNRALSRVALLYNTTDQYDKAVPHFRKLQQLATNRREEYDAWNGLMEACYHTGKYDSTLFFGDQILAKGAFSANATNRAQLFMGKAYYKKEEHSNAIDYFINTVNTAKDIYGAEAQYLMAEILHSQGDYGESNEALYDLNENFGMYEEWVGQSFLLIAENFVKMGELFQAKATLNSLIEKSPVDHIVREAEKLLKEVESQEKEKSIADTTGIN